MSAMDQLLSIASEPIGPAIGAGSAPILADRGDSGLELLEVLRARNGFYAFLSALHVFPLGKSAGERDLESWNAETLWRDAYADLAAGCLFFAEDIFGGQFCLKNGAVFVFDPETGEQTRSGGTLEEWAQHVLLEHDVLCGTPLAREWQERYGALPPGRRLIPKMPFVLGGDFAVENLYVGDPVDAMRFRGALAQQLRSLPDGATIQLKVTH
jgi:hypothetical protein